MVKEGDEFRSIERQLANAPDPLLPFGGLGFLKVPPVHFMEAVGIQGEADNLFDEPFPVLHGKMLAESCLELGDQVLVDPANDRIDIRHRCTILLAKGVPWPGDEASGQGGPSIALNAGAAAELGERAEARLS